MGISLQQVDENVHCLAGSHAKTPHLPNRAVSRQYGNNQGWTKTGRHFTLPTLKLSAELVSVLHWIVKSPARSVPAP